MKAQTKYQLFQPAFHTWYEQLCRYAFALTKEYDSSEDIVQEVFLRV